MAKYDFAVDEDKLNSVCDTMDEKAVKAREMIDDIYNIIEVDLAEHWVSSAYENFRDTCGKYKIGLNELANMIELFGTSAKDISAEASKMLTDINSKFN